MKELNFNNADLITDDNKLIFKNRIRTNENIKIDSTSIILEELESSEDITANYSLITLASLIGKNIEVKNNLICLGDIECEILTIQGDLKCYGNVNVQSIDIKGCATINTGYIDNGNIEKNLIVESSLEVVKDLSVKGSLICNEGIIGEGTIHCDYVYAHDYLEINLEGNKISSNVKPGKKDYINSYDNILLKIQESDDINDYLNSIEYKESIKNIELIIEEIDNKIPSLDNEYDENEIINILKKLSLLDKKYKFDSFILKVIDKIQDSKRIDDLYEFLKLVNYKKKVSDYMLGIDLCRYTFNNFLDKQKSNIENMNVDSIKTNEDFAKVLTLLEANKEYFTKEEYTTILEKLYTKIGVSLKLISKKLELDI